MSAPEERSRETQEAEREIETARRTPTVLGSGWSRFGLFATVLAVVVLGLALAYFGRHAL